MHHRVYPSPEDQKVVNRWRLVVITVYSSLALVLMLFTTFLSEKDGATVEARMKSTDMAHPVNVKR